VIAPAAGASEKSHNCSVVLRLVGRMGAQMSRIGQIALGALVAVYISAASAGMDRPQFNQHQTEFAARQLGRLYDGVKVVEGMQSVIRSLLKIAE